MAQDEQNDSSAGYTRFLVLKLKPEWRLEGRSGTLASEEGESVDTKLDLPPGSRIVRMIPGLAGVEVSALSPEERNLARYLHVLLPEGVELADFLEIVRKWPCTDEGRLPPEPELTGGGTAGG